jgi:hypothetical protein
VNSPPANRLSADGSPPAGTFSDPYSGYAIFANMGSTPLGNANPFQIRERLGQAGTNNILGTATDWNEMMLTGVNNGATPGAGGFENGVPYTLMWTLTRNGSGIDIDATLAGGTTYNNIGSATIDANDSNGNGFAFDTFNVRPSSQATTADLFDTTLFKVEFITLDADLLGDFDDDGDVDLTDYLTLLANLHTDVSPLLPEQSYVLGDITRDRKINGNDFFGFVTAYDEANGLGAFQAMLTALPEPGGLHLTLFGAAGAAVRRRKQHLSSN